ncbi:hypothetical protein TNCV_4107631 [Trichonephila clavipes]|nr:hypothetical protein TNCV_4107631 [Trichonephila clavipes]
MIPAWNKMIVLLSIRDGNPFQTTNAIAEMLGKHKVQTVERFYVEYDDWIDKGSRNQFQLTPTQLIHVASMAKMNILDIPISTRVLPCRSADSDPHSWRPLRRLRLSPNNGWIAESDTGW